MPPLAGWGPMWALSLCEGRAGAFGARRHEIDRVLRGFRFDRREPRLLHWPDRRNLVEGCQFARISRLFFPCLLGCLATRGPRDLILEVPERDAVYSEPAHPVSGFPCSRRREASRTRRKS